jgi:hypothetical protein
MAEFTDLEFLVLQKSRKMDAKELEHSSPSTNLRISQNHQPAMKCQDEVHLLAKEHNS